MNLFTTFEFTTFPEESCTVPNPREPDVHGSTARYLCVVVDDRWPNQCQLRVLSPYIAKDLDSDEILYGWTDGDGYVDHKERSIHDDHERVVAWDKIEQEDPNFLLLGLSDPR